MLQEKKGTASKRNHKDGKQTSTLVQVTPSLAFQE